ncbi:nucleoside recognition domain-containing protein [Desulfobacterium sp. N47]|uniref:Spore maturation protein A n=1 Tax=uncultured Desulfobacterium sp. TaxID=201089 RepID=E1YHH2_9BACT|nr:Spore maturation protein A [uncultured Desulfobacterium sp.]
MNIIWLVLITVSIITAVFTGKLEDLTKAIFDGAKTAVEISLFLAGIVSLWLGITRIIEESGLIYKISRFFKPVISRLFKNIPENHPAVSSITLNILANFFGLGNAATPLGIKAMQDLQTLNEDKENLTFEMMLFIVVNTASIQFVPFTIVGILSDFGSSNPSGIVFPTLCATLISAVIAVCILFLFKRLAK